MTVEQQAVEGHDPFSTLSTELRAVLDEHGALRWVSASWQRLLGCGATDLDGLILSELVHVADRGAVGALLAALHAGERPREVELRLEHRRSGYVWVRCQAAPGTGADVLGYLVAHDVTELSRDRVALALLEEESGIGTWEMDLGSQIAVWSPLTHRLLGSDPVRGEATLAVALERFPPGAREILEGAFDALRTSGDPYDLELPFLAPDGTGREVRAVGRAVLRGGVVLRVHGTFEDITHQRVRQRERQELAATKSLLEESQRLARLGHFEGDLRSSYLSWSPVMYEIFGIDPGAGVPERESVAELVHPDDRPAGLAASERLQHEGEASVDLRIVRADGSVRSVRQLARVTPHPGGSPTRVVGIVQDLTELRATEQALRESQEQLERVLAATNDGWWDIRLDGGRSFYSDRWWALCGYVPGELPAEPEPWRQVTHPDDLRRFEAAFDEVLASGARTFVLPSAGLHRDGRRIPVVVRGLIDYDAEGTPVRVSGATSDVSEAHQAELAKEQFLATVSHELRTPLTAIGGSLELLERGAVGALPETASELLEVAQRNTRRLRLLIDDLLDLEGMPSGDQPLRLGPHRLGELLARAVADNQPYADVHGVRLVLRSPSGEVEASVDAGRIEQVLANLLSNAAKYAPRGSEVDVRLRRLDGDRSRARIEVVDRGPGVATGFQERIFDRFVQADPLDPRSRGGTGLGLAISREIVERHGGRIGLDSEPGRTCFWFDLPVSRDAT